MISYNREVAGFKGDVLKLNQIEDLILISATGIYVVYLYVPVCT